MTEEEEEEAELASSTLGKAVLAEVTALRSRVATVEQENRALRTEVGGHARVLSPAFAPQRQQAPATVSGSSSGIDWSRFPDHDPDYLAGRISLPEATRRLAAQQEAARQHIAGAADRPRCLVCGGTGARPRVPGWAREGCTACPDCDGTDVHCRSCDGSGKAGGQRLAAPAVPCDACKGTGRAHGGGEVLWDLGDGTKLTDTTGQPMGGTQQRTLVSYGTEGAADSYGSGLPAFLQARLTALPGRRI